MASCKPSFWHRKPLQLFAVRHAETRSRSRGPDRLDEHRYPPPGVLPGRPPVGERPRIALPPQRTFTGRSGWAAWAPIGHGRSSRQAVSGVDTACRCVHRSIAAARPAAPGGTAATGGPAVTGPAWRTATGSTTGPPAIGVAIYHRFADHGGRTRIRLDHCRTASTRHPVIPAPRPLGRALVVLRRSIALRWRAIIWRRRPISWRWRRRRRAGGRLPVGRQRQPKREDRNQAEGFHGGEIVCPRHSLISLSKGWCLTGAAAHVGGRHGKAVCTSFGNAPLNATFLVQRARRNRPFRLWEAFRNATSARASRLECLANARLRGCLAVGSADGSFPASFLAGARLCQFVAVRRHPDRSSTSHRS